MIVSVENVTLSILVSNTKVLKVFYKGVSVVETLTVKSRVLTGLDLKHRHKESTLSNFELTA